ncbi:hypothetical protein B0H66DRAFT_560002 [Apodospora peruviana]|uniref:Uncharacterized protein n=1 Tax=Apodospora peruviana TaxID=516989 RepID=A0AAE0HZZ6_9PEZI|nr:hypothetical protein B0H66DRAFT_560002 [Apodospora peruviana]
MLRLCPGIEELRCGDEILVPGGTRWTEFNLPKGSLVKLRHPDVCCDDVEVPSWTDNFTTLFQATPNITHLIISHVVHCEAMGATFERLTDLDLKLCDLDANSFGTILRACPRLERLKFLWEMADWGASRPFMPEEATRNILEYAPNLNFLDLNMQDCAWNHLGGRIDVARQFSEASRALTAQGIVSTFESMRLTR